MTRYLSAADSSSSTGRLKVDCSATELKTLVEGDFGCLRRDRTSDRWVKAICLTTWLSGTISFGETNGIRIRQAIRCCEREYWSKTNRSNQRVKQVE